MTPIAGPGRPHAAGANPDATLKPKADAQILATARQALDQAQGRVDADKRAHSRACVAVDQKGVDKASADLAQAQAQAQTAASAAAPDASGGSASGRVLSITA